MTFSDGILIEFVCLARHRDGASQYAVTTHKTLHAYCAEGGRDAHEWVRVPMTRLEEITIHRMESRPPVPSTTNT